jgi:hypothetical protein
VDLAGLIDATPWVDTHEHLVEERWRLQPHAYEYTTTAVGGRSILASDWAVLVDGYTALDMIGAGLDPDLVDVFYGDGLAPLEKWELIAPFLPLVRQTGTMRAVDLTTERLFGLSISRGTIEELDARSRALRVEGFYRHVLSEVANVSHCQVHTLDEHLLCETAHPDLLRQDLALTPLAFGEYEAAELASGIEVGSLDDYLRVVDWSFERYAAQAVAVKCAWAYQRPLAMAVPDTPPRREFERLRAGTAQLAERRRVEDFLLQRCIDLATDAGLPVKLHLGYLAGVGSPAFPHVYDHVRDVVGVVQANPATTFVMMHTAWPQQEQLLALARHQPNVMIDLCWSWIATPLQTEDFLARALTTLSASKLLCFGGDYNVAEHVVGHATIARRGLCRALESLVDDGWLEPDAAERLVPVLMHGNAERVFPVPANAKSGGKGALSV